MIEDSPKRKICPPKEMKWLNSMTSVEGKGEEHQHQNHHEQRRRAADPPGRKDTFMYQKSPNRPSRQSLNRMKDSKLSPKRQQDGDPERPKNALLLKHPFPGTDQTLRIQVHATLLRLESRRRSETSLHFKAMKEQWDVTQGILQEGLKDVTTAERLLVGIAKADKAFAANLQAVSHDKLVDVKRNIVKSPTRQSKLYKERKADADMRENYLQPFHTVIDNSLRVISEQATIFDENADRVTKYILPELSQLKGKLQERSTSIKSLGEKVMKDIKLSEDLVLNTWGILDTVLSPQELMDQRLPHSPSRNTAIKPTEDSWLVEHSYKTAVSYQVSILSSTSNNFCRIRKQIASFEETRINGLRSILLFCYVQQQQQLLASLPQKFQELLECVKGIPIGIESESANGLLTHRFLGDENDDDNEDSDLTKVQRIEDLFGNPLKSPTILMLKVLEIKTGGLGGLMSNSWKMALVIISKKGDFHVFAVPNTNANGQNTIGNSGISLEVFRSLYPETPSFERKNQGKKHSIIDKLVPVLSTNLKHCSFDIGKPHKNEFDVNGGTPEPARSKSLLSSSSRCTLRLGSEAATSSFLERLENVKLLALTLR